METKTNKINLLTTSIIGLLLASIAVSAFAIPSHVLAQTSKNISTLNTKNNANLLQHGNNEKTCGINSGNDKETKDDIKGISDQETKDDIKCSIGNQVTTNNK